MEDVTKNMNDLFALAKNARVEYPINNITTVINSAAATTGAVGGASAFFKLSNIAIMLGSITTVVTVAVILSTPGEQKNNVVENKIQIKKEKIIEKQRAIAEMPTRNLIEQNELVSPVEIEPEAPVVEEPIVVEQVLMEEVDFETVEEFASDGGNIEPFHSVQLNISVDVTIRKGMSHSVDFGEDTDIAGLLELKINKGTLYIGIRKGKEREYRKYHRQNKDLELVLTMAEVKDLIINGSGDIYSPDDIKSDDLNIQINGSGDVKLDRIVPEEFVISVNGSGDVSMYGDGDTGRGEININGSGDVCTRSIDISEATININGSGDVKVSCQEKLDITIQGSGDICYSGSPQVNMSKMGSGEARNCGRR